MVEHTGKVEFVEIVLSVFLFWFRSVVSADVLELLEEVGTGKQFDSADNLSDNVLELIVDDDDVVTVGS